MPVNIYSAALTSGAPYSLIYAIDNINTLTINKSTGIVPFSLPMVENIINTSGRLITEQCEFIHIGGIDATVALDFEIGMNDIETMLSLVTNKVATQHKIEVMAWSGEISNVSFEGIIDSVRIKQDGGDTRLSCNISFMEGANTLSGMGT